MAGKVTLKEFVQALRYDDKLIIDNGKKQIRTFSYAVYTNCFSDMFYVKDAKYEKSYIRIIIE